MSAVPTDLDPAGRGALEPGGMALHRQLFLVLRDQIVRGAFSPGSALPTEAALGVQYGVSRITVRRALQDLSDEGYLERRHGVGTFVLEQHGAPESAPLTVMDGLRKVQLETTVEVLAVEVRRPPNAVRASLGLTEINTDALFVLRVRRDKADGEPLMVSEAWLPERFASSVTERALRRKPLYQVLSDAGVSMGRVAQEITAELADPLRAHLLEMAIGAALLRINRFVFDQDQAPVQVHSLYLSPQRSRILMDIPAEHLDTATTGLVAHDLPRPEKVDGGSRRSSR
jgi:GntR family transcriptional regulator